MPFVKRITIFPVKSCDGIDLSEVSVLPRGALCHDRQFALAEPSGKLITAKRFPQIHRLCLQVNPVRREFAVSIRGQAEEVQGHLDSDGKLLSDWLSHFFSFDVSIVENDENGFPDDLDAPGPTIVSTATLQTVSDWFPGLTIDEVRFRFRANIEVDGVDPFWRTGLSAQIVFRSRFALDPFCLVVQIPVNAASFRRAILRRERFRCRLLLSSSAFDVNNRCLLGRRVNVSIITIVFVRTHFGSIRGKVKFVRDRWSKS